MDDTQIVSYLRVSSRMQGACGPRLETQREAVRVYLMGGALRVAEEFVEVDSGRDTGWPSLELALAAARARRCPISPRLVLIDFPIADLRRPSRRVWMSDSPRIDPLLRLALTREIRKFSLRLFVVTTAKRVSRSWKSGSIRGGIQHLKGVFAGSKAMSPGIEVAPPVAPSAGLASMSTVSGSP